MLLFCYRRYSAASWEGLHPWKEGVNKGLTPIDFLHKKLFKNYTRWTQAMHAPPAYFKVAALNGQQPGNVSKAYPRSAKGDLLWYKHDEGIAKLYDVVLWFLIWGEAGNLRHMPECICFLYHKVRS